MHTTSSQDAILGNPSYTSTAKWLHWMIGICIIAAWALGITMAEMHGLTPTKIRLVNYHKWLGVTVLCLTAIRLLWRLWHPAPALPATVPKHERLLATLTHAALYALMFALPLSGYFMSMAAGRPVVYLGLIPLPTFIEPNKELGHLLHEAHEYLAWAMLIAFCLHMLGVIKHALISRDGVVARMMPSLRRETIKEK